jgi:hypothetical protein
MPRPLQRLWPPRRTAISVSGDKVVINVLGWSDRHHACSPGRHRLPRAT